MALSLAWPKSILPAVKDRKTHLERVEAHVRAARGPKDVPHGWGRSGRQEKSLVAAHPQAAWRAAAESVPAASSSAKANLKKPKSDYREAGMPRGTPEWLGTLAGAVMSRTRYLAPVKELCFGNSQPKTPGSYQAARTMAGTCRETPPGVCLLCACIQVP